MTKYEKQVREEHQQAMKAITRKYHRSVAILLLCALFAVLATHIFFTRYN